MCFLLTCTHAHLYLWFMHGSFMKFRRSLHPCLSPCLSSVGYFFIMNALGFFLGSCRVLYFFISPCFFPCFVKRLDWGQEWRTKRALNRWEIVGGMLKSMQRVGGQFWKSELDIKLTLDCLVKSDFVEQKSKFVSRLNPVMFRFIYR